MSEIIQVNNLVKQFKDVTAVNGLSFSVESGECFGFLGPNGAGKTSTIRMLYGFSPPTSGELFLFGKDITTDWREIKSRIGVCQQDNTLDPDLSVIQNLTIFAQYFSIPRKVARDRAEELLDFFAMTHKRHAKVMELSGGMVRRLILARALINKPDLLILDEPTTGLDPQSRHQLWERLEKLRDDGLTILLTTHYMEEASRLCDRLIIVDHGKILVSGQPTDLIKEHAGHHVFEVETEDPSFAAFLEKDKIPFDKAGERYIVYASEDSNLKTTLQEKTCCAKWTYRLSSLEDVFLRLTGRDLRE